MKKIFKFFAVAAMAAVAFACSKDETDGGVSYKYDSDAIFVVVENPEVVGLESVELLRTGDYRIVPTRGKFYKAGVAKALTPAVYEGSFTKSGNTYNLDGMGTMTIQKAGGVATINLQRPDAEAITFSGNISEAISGAKKFDGKYAVKTTQISVSGTSLPEKLAARFTGLDVNEIAAWLIKKDVDLEDMEIPENQKVTEVRISQFGTIAIKFANGANYEGKWDWENVTAGLIDYDWFECPEIEILEGDFSIKSSGSNVVLTVETEAKDSDGAVYNVVVKITLKAVK